MPRSKPRFLKYFDAFHEDYPLSQLPEEIQTCGDCGSKPSACHLFEANAKGRKKGIESVVVRLCDNCEAVHVSQFFTANCRGSGVDLSHLEALAVHFAGDGR